MIYRAEVAWSTKASNVRLATGLYRYQFDFNPLDPNEPGAYPTTVEVGDWFLDYSGYPFLIEEISGNTLTVYDVNERGNGTTSAYGPYNNMIGYVYRPVNGAFMLNQAQLRKLDASAADVINNIEKGILWKYRGLSLADTTPIDNITNLELENIDIVDVTEDGWQGGKKVKLRASSGIDQEQVQDIVGAMLTGAGNISISYNDTLGTITIDDTHNHDTLYVPLSRTINSKSLSTNIVLNYSDVGAAAASHTHTKSDITDFSHTHSISDVSGLQTALDNKVNTSDVVTTATANKILKLDANAKLPASITGNADGNASTATKLQTARNISLSGDITGLASFDGSADASITTALSNTGVTAGTYTKVTVDTKGRVTAGTNLSASDLPTHNHTKSQITDFSHTHIISDVTNLQTTLDSKVNTSEVVTTATANKILKLDSNAKLPASITGNAATATKLETARTITIGGSAKGFDGSANVSFTLGEIGAAATSHTHTKSQITDFAHTHTKSDITDFAHTHNLITYQDTRSDNFTPFTKTGVSLHLKYNTTDGLNDGGEYHGVMHIAQWSDITGGKSHQLGLTNNNNLYIRSAIDASTWGSWEKLSKEGHTHTKSQITDFSHTHPISEVTNLQTTLDSKVNTSDVVTTATANKILKLDSSAKLPASITGNAATATKLETARTINGTSFDGSANITTSIWGTSRTITIGSTGKSVNGSGNVSWSLSEIGAASTSHSHSNYTPFASNSQTIPKNTPSGAWYRIATSASGVGRNDGIFELELSGTGIQRVSFRASSMYNYDNSIQIVKMGGSRYNTFGIQSVRVVYYPNTHASQYAYVEVFVTNTDTTTNATLATRLIDAIGWILTTGAGSIPTNYTAKELSLKNCNPLYSTEEKKNTINPTSGVLNLDFSLPNRMLVSTNITQNTTINISNLYDGAVGTILLYLSGTYSITLGTMTNDVSASITKHTVGSYSNLQTGFYTLTYYVIIDHNSIWRIFFNISPKYS